MLKNQTDSVQSMTIQNLENLDAKNGETMQGIADKSNNGQQQLTASKNGHISFSVASLLADTRPTRSNSPVSHNSSSVPLSTTPPNHSSEDEYDSNQEDSIVDVEDLNSDQKEHTNKDNEQFNAVQREYQRESILNQGPIRPTPFSALAAAVYQATHPNWNHQSLVTPFGTPGPIFQNPTPFGVPNMNSGKIFI